MGKFKELDIAYQDCNYKFKGNSCLECSLNCENNRFRRRKSMTKNILVTLGIIAVLAYLTAVVVCNIEHNKECGIQGMNPCGSCWALHK